MARQLITSESNPLVKDMRQMVRSARHCRKAGMTIAEGIHLMQEALKRPELIRKVVLRSGADAEGEVAELMPAIDAARLPVVELPAHLFNTVCPVDTSVGIMCLMSLPEDGEIRQGEDALFLDGVQDPGNVGTIIRAAAASGVKTIFASPQSAWLWSPKALRAGMGAHFQVQIRCSTSLEEAIEATGGEVLVADARGGEDVYKEAWGDKATLWVFGSEGLGVSEKALSLADKILLIPIEKSVESLNVAMAATVCLFEQRRRRLNA